MMEEYRINEHFNVSPRELFAFLASLKGKEYRSNSHWTIRSLEDQYDAGGVQIILSDNLALVLHDEKEELRRLYYYAKSPDDLKRIRSILPPTSRYSVCDLVGKLPLISTYADELCAISFTPYAEYRRMECADLIWNTDIDTSDVTVASEHDLPEVLEILMAEFDPLTSHIPDQETIRKRISLQDVFLIRGENQIAGFIIFDSRGKKRGLLDYVVVRPAYRRMRIAQKIWWHKLETANECSSYYLWVNIARTTAVKFHESNGFRFDGLCDRIFTVE